MLPGKLSRPAARLQEVFILSTARTPLGSMGGKLQSLSAVELGSAAIRAAVERAGLDAAQVEECYMGCVLQAGLGQAPARQAALGAGLPHTTPATTVNKVCASGLKAMTLAVAELRTGQRDVMVAGGMESLSNSPFLLPRGTTPYGGVRLADTCHQDALTDAYTGWHMGRCAEETAKLLGISREAQDDYGLGSYERAERAAAAGIAAKQITTVVARRAGKEYTVDSDEEVGRHDPSSFRSSRCYWGDTVGAGSSSKLGDGAAAAVLGSSSAVARLGLQPLARVVGYSDAALQPTSWPVAPATGVRQLLDTHGLQPEDISLWEINEAFAVVVLANCRLLGIPLAKVNIHGGAIALGHPFGMSGARMTGQLVASLQPGQLGVATLCNGGGGAGSVLVHRL